MRLVGIEPKFPRCILYYLIEYLSEMGPCNESGMGLTPLTHLEMRAWQQNSGIDLTPWEVRALRRASVAFRNQTHKARDRNAPPPFDSDQIGDWKQRAMELNMRNFFAGAKAGSRVKTERKKR